MSKKLLKSTAIFDSINDQPFSGGVLIEDERIIAVLRGDEINQIKSDGVEVLDYGDKLLLPGFVDGHTHMGECMDYLDETFCVDVSGTKSMDEVMQRMKIFAEQYPANPVVLGANLNFFEHDVFEIPTAKYIDEYFPDKAAVIRTWDMHTYYANTKALNMAGFSKDDTDENNALGRDENGDLDGSINDTAAWEIQRILERPMEQRQGALKNFMNKLNEHGVTSMADLYPCGVTKPYELYKSMEDQLTVRIHFFPELLEFDWNDLEYYQTRYHSDMLQFAGLKNLLDGVLPVWTAWMLEPYTNKPDTCGFPCIPPEDVHQKILESCARGIPVRVHTIGDKAIRVTLDYFEDALNKYGPIKKHHTMEHLEHIHPDDVPRFVQLGVVASMQLKHAAYDIDDDLEYLGPEREPYSFNWKRIKDTGAIMATGSDFPVTYFNPMLGIYTGVTRMEEDGHPEGGWLPDQKLTLPECLKIYTIGSAHAINREGDVGTLEPGKFADITVLDQNLFLIEPKEILSVKPLMTMVAGEIVYEK